MLKILLTFVVLFLASELSQPLSVELWWYIDYIQLKKIYLSSKLALYQPLEKNPRRAVNEELIK